jgi:nucleotide-binding universal stress UspA family protein
MFRKILLPTDGSRHSAEAARIAAEVATRHSGTVQPLVAVEYQFVEGEDLPAEVSATIKQRIQQRADRALAEANRIIQEAGGRSEGGEVAEGAPAEVILKRANEGAYDLIVMGSRGVSLERGYDRLIGSVAERVLHRTPCPVLVIRAPGAMV